MVNKSQVKTHKKPKKKLQNNSKNTNTSKKQSEKDILESVKNKMVNQNQLVKFKKPVIYVIHSLLIANVFLLVSSIWFEYLNFYTELFVVSGVLLVAGFWFNKYVKYLAVLLGLAFFASFFVWNLNYMFVFGICMILGILGVHFIEPELPIPHFVYSLIPLLILGHIIWMSVLPFGFDGSWSIDVGGEDDFDTSADLYIIDNDRVLSPRQSYGEKTWREFTKDGSIQIGFNTPVYLENKTVEISMEYEAESPIYINGELFYDPAWGASVELMNEGEVFVYGADVFNITRNYKNVSVELFLNLTNYSSVSDYLLGERGYEIREWREFEREEARDRRLGELLNESGFGNVSDYLEFVDVMNGTGFDFGVYGELTSFLNGSYVLDNMSLNSSLQSPNSIESFVSWSGFEVISDYLDWELSSAGVTYRADYGEYSGIEEYMYAHYSNGVAMKDFTGLYSDLELEMNSRYLEWINSLEAYPDWNDEDHVVNTTFRGPVTFYGVFNDTIEFSLEKQDRNNYNGSDDIIIQVIDLEENIVANWSIPDNDGIYSKDKSSDWIQYNFSFNINKSGVYKFEMLRNKSNKYEDFYIKNIKFNSKKIIFESNNLLLMKPAMFYLNDGEKGEIYYWYDNKFQNIILDNKNIYLNPEDKGKKISLNLNNTKSIQIEKGGVRFYGNNCFSFWKNGWFKSLSKDDLVKLNKKTNYYTQNFDVTKFNNLTFIGYQKTKILSINILATGITK